MYFCLTGICKILTIGTYNKLKGSTRKSMRTYVQQKNSTNTTDKNKPPQPDIFNVILHPNCIRSIDIRVIFIRLSKKCITLFTDFFFLITRINPTGIFYGKFTSHKAFVIIPSLWFGVAIGVENIAVP